MARQVSVAKRERTVNILTFYKLRDKYYVRMRSRLSAERVKNSSEFKNTMTHAHRLGIASRLASVIYSQLPPAWKLHDLYRKLTGHAINLLKEGIDPNCILKKLNEFMKELGYQKEIRYHTIHPSTAKLQKPKKLQPQSPYLSKKSKTSVNRVKRNECQPLLINFPEFHVFPSTPSEGGIRAGIDHSPLTIHYNERVIFTQRSRSPIP